MHVLQVHCLAIFATKNPIRNMDVESSCRLSEAVIVKEAKEERNDYTNAKMDSKRASSVLESSAETIDERKRKDLEEDKSCCVIDIELEMHEDLETEVVCRICHLSSDPSSDFHNDFVKISIEKATLIPLGCACKGELENVHPYCGEAWFKLKGNRQCEICGKTAKNVKCLENLMYSEESNERRSDSATSLSETANAYWRGQTVCNLLMACLVIAFVLPWFFRVKLF